MIVNSVEIDREILEKANQAHVLELFDTVRINYRTLEQKENPVIIRVHSEKSWVRDEGAGDRGQEKLSAPGFGR